MPFDFSNPILPGFFPDPSCIHVNGKFYLVNSTFQFFPAIAIHVSEDLLTWKQLDGGISRPDLLDLTKARTRGPCSDGIFAPTIRHNNGTFYIVTSNVSLDYTPTNFIVTSIDPESGIWSDPIPIPFHGMDPSLFFDDDGKVYYQGAEFPSDPSKGMTATISQAEIDVTTGSFLSDMKPIWQGNSKGTWPEGPHLYKRENWYYTILAEGGTHRDHSVTIARSGSPWGPWESYSRNPVLTHKSTSEYVQGIGHADLFQDGQQNWWAVFLGHRVKGDSFPLCRETFLCPVDWTEDGWPVFNDSKPITSKMSVDRAPLKPSIQTCLSGASFELTEDSKGVLYIRNPIPKNYCWIDDGSLVLKADASKATLDTELGTSTFIGVRQRHLRAEFSACLAFNPTSVEEMAGIIVYVDQFRHLDLRVVQDATTPTQQTIQLCTTTLEHGPEIVRELAITESKTSIELNILCSENEYVFRYRLHASDEWKPVGKMLTATISAWGFTGPVLGIFACGLGVTGAASQVKATGIMYTGLES